jgi:myo-inositol-1(or 4)-monophosphatase
MSADPKSKLERSTLQEIHDFARAVVRSGGELAMHHFGHADPEVKYDETLVTEADLEVQEHIRREVQKKFPKHSFLGEEHESIEGPAEADFLWVVDPVDGTSAFSRGYPIWGVSAAVLHDGQPVAGAFYMPVTDELYSATAPGKALLQDKRIEVRFDERIDNESLMLTYSRFHSDFATTFPGKVRSLGSSVAHICYVARGAAWGAVLSRVHVWDVVAGQLILRQAGGEIRDLEGNVFRPADYLESTKIDRVLLAAGEGQHREVSRFLERL